MIKRVRLETEADNIKTTTTVTSDENITEHLRVEMCANMSYRATRFPIKPENLIYIFK